MPAAAILLILAPLCRADTIIYGYSGSYTAPTTTSIYGTYGVYGASTTGSSSTTPTEPVTTTPTTPAVTPVTPPAGSASSSYGSYATTSSYGSYGSTTINDQPTSIYGQLATTATSQTTSIETSNPDSAFNADGDPIPEPSSIALLLSGVAALALRRRLTGRVK